MTDTSIDFSNQKVIVTGGANGIGAAVADVIWQSTRSLVVLDREPCDYPHVIADFRDRKQVIDAGHQAVSLLGGADVLINVAGVTTVSPLHDLDLTIFDDTLAINLHAPILLMQIAGAAMAKSGGGRIVNVTSVHARVSEPGTLAYDVSKSGLEAATRTAAIDFAADRILVNAVAPGFVDTRMSIVDGKNELDSDWFRDVYVKAGQLPIGRASEAIEIAHGILWLAGKTNTYITGQTLVIDGGMLARM